MRPAVAPASSAVHLMAFIKERMGKKIDKATVPTNPIKNSIKAGSRIVKSFLILRGMIWL
jgi:hypothetical protein